jgi:hypothetical protein
MNNMFYYIKIRLKKAEEFGMEKEEALEVLLIRNAQRDKKESADRTNHSVWYNKTTRDSLSKTTTFFSPDQTTGNYDNFTNVTAGNFETTEKFELSNWCGEKTTVTGGDDMDLGNNSDREEEEEEEEQKAPCAKNEVKLKNFSGKLAKLAQDESVASRTMPPQPQEPSSLGLCVTLNNTNNNQNNTRPLLEPESMSSKFDNFKYFNESNLNDESKSACNDYQFNNNQGHFKVPMAKFNGDFNNTTCLQESDVNAIFIFVFLNKG